MITLTFKSLQEEFPKPGDEIVYITSEGGISNIRFDVVLRDWMKEDENGADFACEECEGYSPLDYLKEAGTVLNNYLYLENESFYWTPFKNYFETTKGIYGKEPEPYDYLRRLLFDPIV